MSEFDYKSVPVRFSRLKNIGRSPAHYLYSIRYETPDSATMRQGRLVHAMLLGGLDGWVSYPGERRGKDWTAFKEAHVGVEVTTDKEWSVASEIAAAVLADSEAMGHLDGEHEVPLEFDYDGRACTARLDVLKPNGVTELKVTGNGHPDAFFRTAMKLAYPSQVDWYMRAAEQVRGNPMPYGHIVQVESKPPYNVSCLRLTANALEYGRKVWVGWFEQLRNCEDSGVFPGYTIGTQDFDVQNDVELTYADAEEE